MKSLWGSLLVVQCLLLSCAHNLETTKKLSTTASESNNDLSIVRVVAGSDAESLVKLQSASEDPATTIDSEIPTLVFTTYKDSGFPKREEISVERWNGESAKLALSEGGREHYLKQLFYANTRNASLKGLRHNACFAGDAAVVAEKFFGKQSSPIKNISTGYVSANASEDGKMLGISFEHLAVDDRIGSAAFRLQHCNSGKTRFGEYLGEKLSDRHYTVYKITTRSIASESRDQENLTEPNKVFLPKAHDKNFGFKILDKTTDTSVKRRFVLRADYERAVMTSEERPWQGLDLRKTEEAMKLAVLAQAHFYEGMFEKKTNPDDFLIAQDNDKRYWCHAPWMHIGPSGREAIHGLTREQDMKSSTYIPVYFNAPAGSNWGISYFNSIGCRTLNKVYGSISNPLEDLRFAESNFEDGTMITKILFTTSKLQTLKNAFTWNANASEPGANVRRIKPVKHFQMDISIKDTSLIGSKPELGNWVMIGFYYDPNYNYDKEVKPIIGLENPLKKIANLPKEFMQMRPMGIQTGFDLPETGDTIVFNGAKTNGVEGRLNGPADNPRSSCMSCHGTAGTKVSMVPGFLNEKQYSPFRTFQKLDLNQQLSISRNYWQTEGN